MMADVPESQPEPPAAPAAGAPDAPAADAAAAPAAADAADAVNASAAPDAVDAPDAAGAPAAADGLAAPAAADAAEILRAITRISYLITRARRHDRVRTMAAVPLDRAAVMVLGQLAEAGPVRSGELAARLGVEAPHVTRQVQQLQRAGYASRAPDPDDRRAHLIQLTPAGRAASDRIREAGVTGMQAALAHWSPQELHQLATLLHRMVDDFVAYAAEEERDQPAH